jgi:hydroxyacylglutathione hydrolase
MLEISQFRYAADNLGYVVHSGKQAVVIDGGATKAILDYLKRNRLSPVEILNTHSHGDHIAGNAVLARETAARPVPMPEVAARGSFQLEGSTVEVWLTPGHSRDSVCYSFEGKLVSGDTLFNATIGNCFSGDFEGFFRSVKRLMALPGETLVFAGHDYVRSSLAFARRLEPGNPALDDYEKSYNPVLVSSTIDQELAVNPYFRYDEAPIVSLVEAKGYPTRTEYERWYGLMQIE